MYFLRRLRDAVRNKRYMKWKIKNWFLLHNDASAHQSALVKVFFAKDNETTL
jgi:hypothetical protein